MGDTILRVEGISKAFAGVTALDQVDFSLERGEIHALVGANGAGKSTLIKILTGAYQADSGKIFLEGREVTINNPRDAAENGISAVYQEFSLINQLTVAENIYLGKLPCKDYKLVQKVDWKKANEMAEKVLSMMETPIDTRSLVRNLSVAQKQLVEIAKALSNESKILIMDEPTASLTDNDIDNMLEVVRGLAKKGISIIYVSHRLEELPMVADRLSVFRDGKYITTRSIADSPKNVIIEYMVGRSVSNDRREVVSQDEVIMEVKNFTSGIKFRDVSFQLHKGEVLGFAGLAGAGRTELARAIFGADPKDAGQILIHGQEVQIKSPIDAIHNGIGFVTEDRKEEGLLLNQPIKQNMTITILKQILNGIRLSKKKENEIADEYIASLSIKTSGRDQKARDLSGGNQQKVVIAKWLATHPAVLIMDEPTRGIDVGSKDQIYTLIDSLAKQGFGVIMISSDIPEVIQVSDRIAVMAAGRLTAILENEGLTQELILHHATSQDLKGGNEHASSSSEEVRTGKEI